MAAANWKLEPGNTVLRTELHAQFAGRTQSGISPSSKSSNVFIFADPVSGEKHGYIDGWRDDGCFHYTGEGQRGDQRMKSGNLAVLQHKEDGNALRVFNGARGLVSYMGKFEVDEADPFYITDAPETGGGPIRSVIVFRLRPKDRPAEQSIASSPPKETTVRVVAIEAHLTERTYVDPSREPYEAERRESKLVADFRGFLMQLGHQAHRHQITPAGEAKPLFSDLYVPAMKLLVEAKGTVERGAIRMAVGQLIDYRRFLNVEHCAILVPSEPREDLVKFVQSAGISLYWKSEKTFIHLSPESSSPELAFQ